MLTDKTTLVENESKKLEGTVMSSLRDQREDLEMTLKKQITMLLKDIEDLNSGIARTDEAIEKLDTQGLDCQNKISNLEDSIDKHNQKTNANLKISMDNLEKNYINKVKELEARIDVNKENINEGNRNIE